MIKFFRKYNKQLLAVATVFLMISFIGGFALQSLLSPSPGRRVFGNAYGRPISQADLGVIEAQTRLLSGLGLPWRTPWGPETALTPTPPLNELDYLLLLRETSFRGIRPSVELARVELERSGRDLTRLSLQYGVDSEFIEEALANYLAIRQLWTIARQSVMPSELELRQAVRAQHETVNSTIVRLRAEALQDDQDIPEEVLLAHYDQYKDRAPSNEPLNFGYMIPDRVEVEYIRINASEIPTSRPVTTAQAERFWREHRNEFRRPPEELADPADDEVGPPAEQPTSPFYETFEEAREAVIERLQREARLETARQMASVLWQALKEPWYHSPLDDAGFRTPSEAVQKSDYFQSVIKQLEERLPHPQAVEIQRTGLFSEAEVAELPLIGASRLDTQGGPRGAAFGAGLFQVQGLAEVAPAGGRGLSQFQIASEWTIDDDDNLFLYRVVRVQKSHAPESLADIRDRVIADVRALRAFEKAQQLAAEVQALADLTGDLQVAWDSFNGLDPETKEAAGSWFDAKPFARETPEIFPGFRFPITVSDEAGLRSEEGRLIHQIRSDDFVAGVYALLDEQGPQAIGVIEVPELESCFLVQLQGVNHISRPQYDERIREVEQYVARSRIESIKQFWFSPENIRSRAGYTVAS